MVGCAASCESCPCGSVPCARACIVHSSCLSAAEAVQRGPADLVWQNSMHDAHGSGTANREEQTPSLCDDGEHCQRLVLVHCAVDALFLFACRALLPRLAGRGIRKGGGGGGGVLQLSAQICLAALRCSTAREALRGPVALSTLCCCNLRQWVHTATSAGMFGCGRASSPSQLLPRHLYPAQSLAPL